MVVNVFSMLSSHTHTYFIMSLHLFTSDDLCEHFAVKKTLEGYKMNEWREDHIKYKIKRSSMFYTIFSGTIKSFLQRACQQKSD